MDQSNQGIHGQMVQSSSHSVQSSQEQISLTRWRLLRKKEPFGGMHAHSKWTRATVHGAIVVLPAAGTVYPFPKPDEEEVIVLGMSHVSYKFFIHLVQEFDGWKVLVSFKGRIWPPCKCMVLVAIDLF